MNAGVSQELRSEGNKRAESHPVDIERALMAGARRYRWKVTAAYASVTVIVIVLVGIILLAHQTYTGRPMEVTGLIVTPSTVSLQPGESSALTAQLTYSDGSSEPATAVAWTSSNTSVATVDSAGTVTAAGPGTATISATHSGFNGTATITIDELSVTGLIVTPAAASLRPGESSALIAQLTYSDESSRPATAVAWTSSNTSVATVDSTGTVTAAGPGTATISATQSGFSGTATITIDEPSVTGLIVTPAAISLQLGESSVLTAQLTYSDGSNEPATAAAWISSNDKVAQVDNGGTVTAAGPGTATISATQSGISGTATITIDEPSVTGLTITPAAVSLQPGESSALTAQLTYSDGTSEPATAMAWTSSNNEIAQVDSAGTVTANGPGTATISATQSGISGTATITIDEPSVTGLTITPPEVSMQPGESLALTAQLTYSDGTSEPATAVAWTSSNDKIAQVDSAGTLTATGPGTATISATQSGVSGTATITVVAPEPPPEIEVS